MSKGDIRFCVDTMIVETVIGNPALVKQGGMLSDVAPLIQSYVSSKIDPKDKAGSVLDMLAPAGIFTLFRSFGFTKLGLLVAGLITVLHIDVHGMVESLFNEVKGSISKGEPVTPAQITNAVSNMSQSGGTSPADTPTVAQDLREARILRLALEQYENQMLSLTKRNKPIFAYAAGAKATSIAARIIGWIFTIVLTAAGFMVAGDAVNKMLGRPNSFDGTYQAGKEPAATAPTPTTTQTKFKPTGSGTESPPRPWMENTTNDPGSIENMLVQFTKDVYSGLNGKEAIIRSSPSFQAVKSQIVWYNKSSAGEPMVYIPANYANKKAIVDHYIDEVAKDTPDAAAYHNI